MSSMPRSNQALDYFLIYQLKFDSNKIGYLQIVSSIAFLISVIIITIQSRKSHNFSLRSLFAIWTFIACIVPYFCLILIFGINRKIGISDFLFASIDTIIVRITIDMLLLGTAVLYARICPPGIEGVFFTLLTSVATIGEVLSYALSAFFINIFDIQCTKIYYNTFNIIPSSSHTNLICDFNNLWLLIIAVNLCTLIPLMWIFWIPNEIEMKNISITLRQAAANRLNHNKYPSRKYIKENEMISLYFIVNDYLFPFFKHCICACCIKAKYQRNQYI